jgi:hypothetical protein
VIRKPEQSGGAATSDRLMWFRPYVLSSDSNDSNTMFGEVAIALNVFLEADV